MIKWIKVTDYAIKSSNGRFHINKNYLDGATLYLLYDRDTIIGHYEHPDDAREMAETLDNVDSVGDN